MLVSDEAVGAFVQYANTLKAVRFQATGHKFHILKRNDDAEQ